VKMGNFKVAEHFVSINGEGRKAGELAFFIRFAGCNLDCAWCDTKWANAPGAPVTLMDIPQLCRAAQQSAVKNITLTGGEPLLQENITGLIKALAAQGHSLEIETNGSVLLPLDLACDVSFTMDYKLPSSAMQDKMCLENFSRLREKDTVKFVCADHSDLECASQIIKQYSLTDVCKVYFSPVFGSIDPKDIVEYMVKNGLNGVRLQLQLHKFIWDPDKRGV
jgi:7-carboxy-7-deazaguanine synthase